MRGELPANARAKRGRLVSLLLAIFVIVTALVAPVAAQQGQEPADGQEKESEEETGHSHDNESLHRLKYYDDIAYYYASRLTGEPPEGVEDVHFHPMEKTSLRLTMIWKF